MKLTTAIILAIIGICYLFIQRFLGTFVPEIFRLLTIAQISSMLIFVASLTVLYFFIKVYRDYIKEGQEQLRRSTTLAIIGAALMSLLLIKGIVLTFNRLLMSLYEHSPSLVAFIKTPSIEHVVPLLSTLFTLFFFIAMYNTSSDIRLKNASIYAIIGSCLTIALNAVTLFNFIVQRESPWFSGLSTMMIVVLLPVVTISFLASLYFYVVFYQHVKE